MFSNIELSLGYNIMTLEHVVRRIWEENPKNVWKKSKILDFRHFFLGGRGVVELVYIRIHFETKVLNLKEEINGELQLLTNKYRF